jgi:hypothetical protein
MKTVQAKGIIAHLNHKPPWSVFVKTRIQAEVEAVMTNLGFGCTEYNLQMATVEEPMEKPMQPVLKTNTVCFTWSGKAMELSDWGDNPDMAADIMVVIRAAQKTRKKVGKGCQYRFQCTRAEAAEIERLTRNLANVLLYDVDRNNRQDGRVLAKAADQVKKALAQ